MFPFAEASLFFVNVYKYIIFTIITPYQIGNYAYCKSAIMHNKTAQLCISKHQLCISEIHIYAYW